MIDYLNVERKIQGRDRTLHITFLVVCLSLKQDKHARTFLHRHGIVEIARVLRVNFLFPDLINRVSPRVAVIVVLDAASARLRVADRIDKWPAPRRKGGRARTAATAAAAAAAAAATAPKE